MVRSETVCEGVEDQGDMVIASSGEELTMLEADPLSEAVTDVCAEHDGLWDGDCHGNKMVFPFQVVKCS